MPIIDPSQPTPPPTPATGELVPVIGERAFIYKGRRYRICAGISVIPDYPELGHDFDYAAMVPATTVVPGSIGRSPIMVTTHLSLVGGNDLSQIQDMVKGVCEQLHQANPTK